MVKSRKCPFKEVFCRWFAVFIKEDYAIFKKNSQQVFSIFRFLGNIAGSSSICQISPCFIKIFAVKETKGG